MTKNQRQIPAVHSNVDLALDFFGGDGKAFSGKPLPLVTRFPGTFGRGFDDCPVPELYGTALDFGGTGGGTNDIETWRFRMA